MSSAANISDRTDEIASAVDDAIVRAATAQSYRLRDGTSVNRAGLTEALDARERLQAEQRARRRGGMFVRLGFGRAR